MRYNVDLMCESPHLRSVPKERVSKDAQHSHNVLDTMRPPDSRTLFDLVREQAAKFPANIAVVVGRRAATYRELADRAALLAAGLRERGVGHGDRVGILINNRLEFLEAAIGA